MCSRVSLIAALALLVAAPPTAAAIPPFARQYHTGCTTCHTAAPKLNVLGEAFRLNGYRFPVNDALIRPAEPVSLGNEEWKQLWPRAIWPGELPAIAPLALRVQLDATAVRGSDQRASTSFLLPDEVYLLGGSSLGEGLAVFAEAEWSRDEGFEFTQAKLEFQDPLRWLPERALNLWVGLQDPYLTTFAARETDRAGRVRFAWQEYRVSALRPRDAAGVALESANEFDLRGPLPTIEVNGLLARRFYYGVGMSQGGGDEATDGNQHKDLYYKVRYKFGGLALDGSYDRGARLPTAGSGQLLDRSLILEHFGYFGAEPAGDGGDDRHREAGVVARVLYDHLDVGVGRVTRRDLNPWGGAGSAVASSWFARLEYMAFPWLIGSFKAEDFRARSALTESRRGRDATLDQARLAPGLVALLRQNVRLVLEGELYAKHAASATLGRERPATLWTRLDFAF